MLELTLKLRFAPDVYVQTILASEPEILSSKYHKVLKETLNVHQGKRNLNKILTHAGLKQFSEKGVYGAYLREIIFDIHHRLNKIGLSKVGIIESWTVNSGVLTLKYNKNVPMRIVRCASSNRALVAHL